VSGDLPLFETLPASRERYVAIPEKCRSGPFANRRAAPSMYGNCLTLERGLVEPARPRAESANPK
jgi:hypothetical protein